jgi:hypothetical protein
MQNDCRSLSRQTLTRFTDGSTFIATTTLLETLNCTTCAFIFGEIKSRIRVNTCFFISSASTLGTKFEATFNPFSFFSAMPIKSVPPYVLAKDAKSIAISVGSLELKYCL